MQNGRARNNNIDAQPMQLDDGSICAVITVEAWTVGRYAFMELTVPRGCAESLGSGQFMMARCAGSSVNGIRSDWTLYLRRPLFVTNVRTATAYFDAVALTVSLPVTSDPGYAWLRDLPAGSLINLLGPFGRHPELPAQARHLLVLASPEFAPLALLAIEEMLNRGGRVTVLIRSVDVDETLPRLFPLAVEIQTASDSEWMTAAASAVKWADSVLIADSEKSPQFWADLLRRHRLRLDDDYANLYVPSDLLCCTGACMACVVERANGSVTRACVHGPLFPLTMLAD